MAIAQYTDDEMYHAWIATNRNASAAAKRLGINARNMQAHVTRKNYEARYVEEFTQVAENTRMMVFTDMLLNMPVVLKELMGIITNPDPEVVPAMAKVRAIETYLRYLPVEKRDERNEQAYVIEIKQPGGGESGGESGGAEDAIRQHLESNIHAAIDERANRRYNS